MKKGILKFGMIAMLAFSMSLTLNSCGGEEKKAEETTTETKCEDGKDAATKCEGTEKKCEGTDAEKKCEGADAEKKCEGAEKKCEGGKCEGAEKK